MRLVCDTSRDFRGTDRPAKPLIRAAPWRSALGLLLAMGPAVAALAGESCELLPHSFTLHGPAARQGLLVERIRDGRYFGQAIGSVYYSSSDEQVVRIEDGIAAPVGNGTAGSPPRPVTR